MIMTGDFNAINILSKNYLMFIPSEKVISLIKIMRHSGIEPESVGWKPTMLTPTPMML